MLIRYDDGREHQLVLHGRKVDSNLRTAQAALRANWIGQDGSDRVGTNSEVGPDGLQDARIQLAGVSMKAPIKAIRIDGPGGAKWESGVNPELLPGAEFWVDPKSPGAGDLFFHPSRDLNGQTLKVRILYQNDTMDTAIVKAGRTNPKLRTPESPLPKVYLSTAKARWLGQDGQDVNGPGDVHVAVSGPGLAAGAGRRGPHGFHPRRLGSPNRRRRSTEDDRGLGKQRPADDPQGIGPGIARPVLPALPRRNRREPRASPGLEVGAKLGRPVPRGRLRSDPSRAGALRRPAPTSKPGDDLQAAVDRGGVVSLAPGTYRLTQPLVLNKPTTLTAERKGTTLLFSQPAGATPWTTAIKIHCGNTTLNGFAVRFEGPIRWNTEVSYGPAVIGTTDDRDPRANELKVGVVVSNLDVEGPAASDPSKPWSEAMRLMRFTNALSGRIEGNRLKGGPIEFFKGPWHCINNVCDGTQTGTFSHGVFAGHGTYDMVVRGNRVKPVEPSGKVWRFLVLTQSGANDLVEGNEIENIGEIEGDGVPRINEPEIMLTESYRLSYEGKAMGLSADGLVLRTGTMQGGEVRPGDVVSLLSGPAAGEWRRVAQPLDPDDSAGRRADPQGDRARLDHARDSSTSGSSGNRIDIRNSRTSTCMVLPGNHFGLLVEKNHLIGGAESLGCSACPTESPITWGWSHAPVLGAVVRSNIFEDSETGAELGVSHDVRYVKVNTGRVYMSAVVEDNQVRWTGPFLARRAVRPRRRSSRCAASRSASRKRGTRASFSFPPRGTRSTRRRVASSVPA